MRRSSQGSYSTKAMIDLAVRFNQGPVLAKDISARQGITRQYPVKQPNAKGKTTQGTACVAHRGARANPV